MKVRHVQIGDNKRGSKRPACYLDHTFRPKIVLITTEVYRFCSRKLRAVPCSHRACGYKKILEIIWSWVSIIHLVITTGSQNRRDCWQFIAFQMLTVEL